MFAKHSQQELHTKYHLKEQYWQLMRLNGESKPWSCLQF